MSISRWIWLLGACAVLIVLLVLKNFWQQHTTPALPDPAAFRDIHVEILNGCGKDGIARQIGTQLRALGFDVMTVDNAETFHYPETLVIDRVGNPEYARLVAQILGTPNHIQQMTPDPFRIEEVTVIIGRDYQRLGLLAAR